jgi:hypothetical protein
MSRITSDKELNTHRGVPRGECSCKSWLFVENIAHSPSSYPLAYSVLVLPFSIVRWSAYDHKRVSSAASFFVMSMYNLSGAVNVLLLLIVRPYLLLLTRPECRVSVRAGLPGLETEGSPGMSKDTKLENQSVHSEMPLSPLTGQVFVLAPPPSSFDPQCCEAT